MGYDERRDVICLIRLKKPLYDLKAGKVVIVCDDEDRENEGDFIALAEKATPEVINFMATHGRGLVCVPIDEELAEKLDLIPMVSKNTDPHGTAFTVSIDHKFSTTGISAFERSATVLSMLDPNQKQLILKDLGICSRLLQKKVEYCDEQDIPKPQ